MLAHAGAQLTVTRGPILGQARAIGVLQDAVRHGHVAHAWIFHGPFGVGKFTTAERVARLLLDPATDRTNVDRFEPPVDSEVSRLIDGGVHPDLHVIRRQLAANSDNAALRARKLQNLPVDLLREFVIGGTTGDGKHREAPVFKSAVLGHSKVFIVEEAELLDAVGQNALLKTLEEPPRRTYLLLLTTREDRLLPTIRSRCQRVAFAPLDRAAMTRWVDEQSLDLTPDAAAWVSAFAAGSPGTALFAARHDLHAWHRELGPELAAVAQGQLPPGLSDELARRTDELAKALVKEREGKGRRSDAAEGGDARGQASKQSANREAAGWMAAVLAGEAAARLRAAVGDGSDPEFWALLIDRIAESERAFRDNVNPKHVFAGLVAGAADDATRGAPA